MDTFKRIFFVVVALAFFAFGAFLINLGMHQPPPPTPDVTEEVLALPNQTLEGPVKSKVVVNPETGELSKDEMTAQNMGPNKLFIPAIKVYTDIDNSGDFGKIVNSSFVLPPPDRVTQWVDGAKVSSKRGNIVVSGHISMNNQRGALYDTANLKAGNIAFISDSKGKVNKFQLYTLNKIEKSALPDDIWSTTSSKSLYVITCGGELTRTSNGSWHYDSNTIARFVPVSEPKK